MYRRIPTDKMTNKMNTEECMVCFEEMSTWNTHRMAGCTHSICVECATKMQTMSDNSSDYTTSSDYSTSSDEDDEYEEVDVYDGGIRIRTIIRTISPPEESEMERERQELEMEREELIQSTIKMIPINYTMKYSKNGYTITRINCFELEGFENPMQCPYCRQHEPMIYDFDEIRFCVPTQTLEWNILERKLYNDNLSSFTMSKEGATFAFKLSKDKSCLRIMWTEVNTFPFTLPKPQTHTHSDFNKIPKKQKDARAYSRPKRYTKMIR